MSEDSLPPEERHQLGQFYTPPAIARIRVSTLNAPSGLTSTRKMASSI